MIGVQLRRRFTEAGLVAKCLEFASARFEHIMDFTMLLARSSLFSLVNQSVLNVMQYN